MQTLKARTLYCSTRWNRLNSIDARDLLGEPAVACSEGFSTHPCLAKKAKQPTSCQELSDLGSAKLMPPQADKTTTPVPCRLTEQHLQTAQSPCCPTPWTLPGSGFTRYLMTQPHWSPGLLAWESQSLVPPWTDQPPKGAPQSIVLVSLQSRKPASRASSCAELPA